MQRAAIAALIMSWGFLPSHTQGRNHNPHDDERPDRYTHPNIADGAVYVSHDRLGGNGQFRELEHAVPATGYSGNRDTPFWEGKDLTLILPHLQQFVQ
jgi:hypothetical protein